MDKWLTPEKREAIESAETAASALLDVMRRLVPGFDLPDDPKQRSRIAVKAGEFAKAARNAAAVAEGIAAAAHVQMAE
jgi:hypothetical protein